MEVDGIGGHSSRKIWWSGCMDLEHGSRNLWDSHLTPGALR